MELVMILSKNYYSQSLQNTKRDSIQEAWLQGVVAAHLNVAAITAALMLACLATGMIIRFQAETFAINTCLNTGIIITF